MTYRPTPDVSKILEWAKQEIDAVPYEVTSRWAFYQVVQKYGIGKGMYRKFLKWTSRARKAFWNGWHPALLADDSRGIRLPVRTVAKTENLDLLMQGGGYDDPEEWFEHFPEERCTLSVQARQRDVLLVLFEAAAMSSQFDYYLDPLRVVTAPFQGDASIRHKWEIARFLDRQHKQYPDKRIVVLYFGDLDPKGLEIPRNALRDIWKWLGAEDIESELAYNVLLGERMGLGEVWQDVDDKFRWIRVGLTPDQVGRLNIPENPEKPGAYQWEALSDAQAGRLILQTVHGFWKEDVVKEVEAAERRAERKWQGLLRAPVRSATHGYPYGYRVVGGDVRIQDDEAAVVDEIFRRYLKGDGILEISSNLLRRGVHGRHGGTFHSQTVANILGNPAYAGYVRRGGKVVRGEHPAIIDGETFNRAQLEKARRIRRLDQRRDPSLLPPPQ